VEFSDQARADFPALTALVESGEIEDMAERVARNWVFSLANSALPWSAVGGGLFVLALLFPRYQSKVPARFRSPGHSGTPLHDTWLTSGPVEDGDGDVAAVAQDPDAEGQDAGKDEEAA
jgi:hypothetical protein